MPVGLKSSLVNLILNVGGVSDLVRYTSQGFIPQRYEYLLRIILWVWLLGLKSSLVNLILNAVRDLDFLSKTWQNFNPQRVKNWLESL